MTTSALIVAGGSGIRFNNKTPKQFLLANGKPILMHTISCFSKFDNICVVLAKRNFSDWTSLCKEHEFKIKHTLVEGGENRFRSVQNGLKKLHNNGIVLIHDGVRPCIKKKMINNLIKNVSSGYGVVPVLPITDSLIYNEEGKIKSVSRKNYFSVQTPQAFMLNEINNAYSQGFDPKFTDDASVFESFGKKIKTVEGDIKNIKVTYPIDLHIVNKYL